MNDKNPITTIITPTFNRAERLRNLYDSLVNQDEKIIWLVVDDGSSDNTEEVVRKWQSENKICIEYIKKENGGKHTALNVGIKKIQTPLTLIIDSDDQLLPGALSSINEVYERYRNNRSIGCYTFLKAYKDGKPVVELNRDEFVENYIRYRIRQNRPGDMAEVFVTEVLKQYVFPEFEGEKFLSEDVVWIQIGENYDTVYKNQAIYECEYLEGGLSDNDKLMKFASPLGSMMRGKMLMKSVCGCKANLKGAIIYDCYKKEFTGQVPESLRLSSRQMIMSWLCRPLGCIFHKKWKV